MWRKEGRVPQWLSLLSRNLPQRHLTVNFDFNCQDMHKMLMDDKKLLEKIHSNEKYKQLEQE